MISIQGAKRWPLWGSCNLLCVPNKPNTLPSTPKNVQLVLVASYPSWPSSHLQGADPHGSKLCQRCPDDVVLLLLCARALHNFILSLPSQQPSNGLFSPMDVRANHLPMCTDPLVPVYRAWSCTSKTTPSMGSSVLDIIAM